MRSVFAVSSKVSKVSMSLATAAGSGVSSAPGGSKALALTELGGAAVPDEVALSNDEVQCVSV